MHVTRERVKAQFPTVLLTLLSIVQALALELLWAHLHEAEYLYEWSWYALLAWGQVFATLATLILIWVVYAGNAMRFRWVPSTGDSVVPFAIGLLEFMMIDSLSPNNLGYWLINLGLVYAAMVWTSQVTMRRARRDPDNQAFFNQTTPAQIRDFIPEMALVAAFVGTGIFILLDKNTGWLAMVALILSNGILLWRFYSATVFWNISIREDDPTTS